MREVFALINKEYNQERRQKYALNAILIYVVATLYIINLSFQQLDPLVWISMLWIILLFSTINACSRSFIQESNGSLLMFYSLVSPAKYLTAKYIYNLFWTLLLSAITLFGFILFFGNVFPSFGYISLILLVGGFGISANLTMSSAIASKGKGGAMLMAILSFPVMIPQLLLLIKLTKKALDGFAISGGYSLFVQLLAIDLIVVVVSYLLFPYLWRD
ncbi:MAG: heme exporter protein CcmB [Bacteroidota bacterium]|nr:heme exporter protein CcmB [Bacteroidota bacterium]